MINKRIIGTYGDPGSSRTFLCFAGIHGNEPEGIEALCKVFERLWREKISVKGSIVGILGNRSALENKIRFVDKDLNRQFNFGSKEDLKSDKNGPFSEMEDILEILDMVDKYSNPDNENYFLDLHATSAPGAAFSVCSPVPQQLALAQSLHFPIVHGLESKLEGTLMYYLYRRNFLGLAFEGGQIGDPKTVLRHEAAIWTCLGEAGFVAKEISLAFQSSLREEAINLPQHVRLVHRQGIEEGQNFRMLEGFSNFDSVKEGCLLGILDGEQVLCPKEARLLMPLYQEAGDDAFFLVEDLKK